MLIFPSPRYERFRSGRSSAQSVNNGVSQQFLIQVVKHPIFASPLMVSHPLMSAPFRVSGVDLHETLPAKLYNVPSKVLLSIGYLSVIYQMYMPNLIETQQRHTCIFLHHKSFFDNSVHISVFHVEYSAFHCLYTIQLASLLHLSPVQ